MTEQDQPISLLKDQNANHGEQELELQSGDIIFISNPFFYNRETIYRGFYKVIVHDGKTYLNPENGGGLIKTNLKENQDNWSLVKNYQAEAKNALNKTEDIIFISNPFFYNGETINRGFYKVIVNDGQTYLNPENGGGLIKTNLKENQDNWSLVKNYQAEAKNALNKTDGWKLHLNFDPTKVEDTEIVRKILQNLVDSGSIEHFKIGSSDNQVGKEATVYVGSKNRAQDAAELIEDQLANILLQPAGETLKDDIIFTTHVMARFDLKGDTFHQYGSQGIPYLKYDMRKQDLTSEQKKERALKILRERYGDFFRL